MERIGKRWKQPPPPKSGSNATLPTPRAQPPAQPSAPYPKCRASECLQEVASRRSLSCAAHTTHHKESVLDPIRHHAPNTQVALWNRYGHVALYDDTAVKNRYRIPIGVLAVIDSEYRTRIGGQSITEDTTTDTFVWMLESALDSRGGKQPEIFIQDADSAMTGAVGRVFPDALPRRCLWHLYQNILKNVAKVVGGKISVRVRRKELCVLVWYACALLSFVLKKLFTVLRAYVMIGVFPELGM